MKILVLGADGYLGWPTCMMLAAHRHQVMAVDSYLRRSLALETNSLPLFHVPVLEEKARLLKEKGGIEIAVEIADCAQAGVLNAIVERFKPDAIIHYAEQTSATYSMRGAPAARLTLNNNLNVTFNTILAVTGHAPSCHIIRLGTMAEYGSPNIDIEEGWLEIEHKGRKDKVLYPRAANSLYHTTRVLDTDLLWFYVRNNGIRVSNLMQGPVYGIQTSESDLDDQLMPNFYYDSIFGMVVNRFLVQAVAGVPLTVYGQGRQARAYINLLDTLQCIKLAVDSPAKEGDLRITNQFTELLTVIEIAEKVKRVGDRLGLNVKIKSIPNVGLEKEKPYYNAHHTALLQLGLQPHYMSDEIINAMLEKVIKYKSHIEPRKLMPRASWNKAARPA